MFERRFEFIVHQPLDICEKRLRRTAPESDTSEHPVLKAIGQTDNTLEVKMGSNASEKYSFAMLEATLKTHEHDTVHITGKAYANKIRNELLILVVTSPLGICGFMKALHDYDTFGHFMRDGIIFTIIALMLWTALAIFASISQRNKLIQFFEETITQEKKKKRA
jgi:hypothetical protein